jgi:hypothetical protein
MACILLSLDHARHRVALEHVQRERRAKRSMYDIVRFYESASIRRRVIESAVTLEAAQRHCNDPETSSETCTSKTGRARTRRLGRWFDGYESR